MTHIKKRTKEGQPNAEIEEDTPMKEESDDSKIEEESPEKQEEPSDNEIDTSVGCTIGLKFLDNLWNVVKSNA